MVRHASTCTRGQTKINCPNKQIRAPASAYERAFYPNNSCSFIGTKWIKWETKQRGIHIHHARCGHGGERYIFNVPVDGYHPKTKTVFQYYGCHWHSCPKCFPTEFQRNEVVRRDRKGHKTITVVEKWEHEEPTPWMNTSCPEKQTATYPHAIVYDFESYQDKTKAACPTRDLSYESEHVPI